MTSYQELMGRVRVDDAMAARVLAGVEASLAAGDGGLPRAEGEARAAQADRASRPEGHPRPRLRLVPAGLAALAAAAVLALVVALPANEGTSGSGASGSSAEPPATDAAAPGFGSYDDVGQLSAAVGFDAPLLSELPFAVAGTSFDSIGDDLAQVSYEGAGREVVVRKAPGEDDVSGDYNDYAQVETTDVGGASVTLKGDGDAWALATWTDGGYAYAVSCDPGLSRDELLALVAQLA